MALRPYQLSAKTQIRAAYIAGHRKVLLKMPTGAGKTTVFSDILKDTVTAGNTGLMVVRGRLLVDQASERLFRDEVSHGVLMANHWNVNARAPVQVASIDTVRSRGILPPATLMVIDEAHEFTSKECVDFVTDPFYDKTFILAVTATPYTIDSLEHLADFVVVPITMQELIDEGYLVKPRYFSPSEPDLKGVREVSGEYVKKQLAERMSVLSGDIVKNWIDKGEGRPTLMFCATIDHSLAMVEEFKRAGVRAEHIEAKTSRAARKDAIERLSNGQLDILSNVGILTTGVDIPPAACIIFAKAVKSYNLYIQIAGRGTRPVYAPGFDLSEKDQRLAAIMASDKKDFLIFDHGGNIARHGYMTYEPEVDVKGRKVKYTGPKIKKCSECYLSFSGSFCPECGKPAPEDEPETVSIRVDKKKQLEELDPTSRSFADEIVAFVKSKKDEAKRKGHKRGWVYYQVFNKYGEEVANELFPKQEKKHEYRGRPKWIK